MRFSSLTISLLLTSALTLHAQSVDLMQDTWVGTDALGRKMPTSQEVGLPKTDKSRTVGIFYVTWHTSDLSKAGHPEDVTQVLHADTAARYDQSRWPAIGGMWHWGEPEYGYFLSADDYVIRHDMSMLADAGVDVIILDLTNAVCYWNEWQKIFDVMEQMKREGNVVPKVCFWSYNGPVITVTQDVYEKYYKAGRYRDLWFYWDGKPLLLCNMRPDLDANGGGARNPNPHYDASAATDSTNPHYGDPDYSEPYYKDYTREVKEFFTMRNMWWGYYKWGGKRYVGTEDNWSFGYEMEDSKVAALTPRERCATHQGQAEQMAVTPAQHPISITGKSWRVSTGEPKLNQYDEPDSAYVPWFGRKVSHPEGYGIYFQDRWDDALQVDPSFIYLNDWNEWTAGKFAIGKAPGSEAPGPTTFLGRKTNNFYFVDQYNCEFNRTLSPVKGAYTDNYYMQMAQNIRRYKGVRPIPQNKGYHKVSLDGQSGWDEVTVVYRDTRGDTSHRNYAGYAHRQYTDSTGRNDILLSKVAADRTNLYFLAQTADALTPSSDPNWMLLLIDADQNSTTGWYGYDYIVNLQVKSPETTTLCRYDAGRRTWEPVADLSYRTQGNRLVISVPRKLLKLQGKAMTFDFKWADNPQTLTNPISLCTHGDTAPNRRFNYRYIWHK